MRTRSLAAAAVLLSASLASHADTITQSFDTGPFTATSNPQSNLLLANGFNSALGTLSSVSISFSGSYIASVPGGALSEPTFQFDSLPSSSGGVETADGTYAISATESSSSSAVLKDFIGSGAIGIDFFYADYFGATDTSASADGFSATLTYTYTPAAPAAIPEPSSIILLGTGLLAAACMLRKRPA